MGLAGPSFIPTEVRIEQDIVNVFNNIGAVTNYYQLVSSALRDSGNRELTVS